MAPTDNDLHVDLEEDSDVEKYRCRSDGEGDEGSESPAKDGPSRVDDEFRTVASGLRPEDVAPAHGAAAKRGRGQEPQQRQQPRLVQATVPRWSSPVPKRQAVPEALPKKPVRVKLRPASKSPRRKRDRVKSEERASRSLSRVKQRWRSPKAGKPARSRSGRRRRQNTGDRSASKPPPPAAGAPAAAPSLLDMPWPPTAPGPPVMPMLHGVMLARVQALTPRGAVLQLTDGSPANFPSGIMQQRRGGPELKSGQRLFVKVMRIEPGIVVVDSQTVDQSTGFDLDPFHERAEVEEWINIPKALVGRIIGKQGTRIRRICEETGADLRFDAPVADAPGADGRSTAPQQGGLPRKRRRKNDGADLMSFLVEAARPDSGTAPGSTAAAASATKPASKPEPEESGADLAAFLEAAKESDSEEAGNDLKDFVEDAANEEGETQLIKFVADNQATWERLLREKLKEAGVEEIWPDRLTLLDADGARIDIAYGLRPHLFPVTVKYMVPAKEKNDDEKPPVETSENRRFSANDAAESYMQKVRKEEPRPNVIHVSGAVRLTRKHFDEFFRMKKLPMFRSVDHISKDEVLLIFRENDEAKTALDGLQEGFDHMPENDPDGGPVLWRARDGMLQWRVGTKGDVKKVMPEEPKGGTTRSSGADDPGAEFFRLRVNGDAVEVAKARAMVLELVEELRLPNVKLEPGDMRDTLLVPSEFVGRIIGRKGENIKRLEQETGTRLRMLEAEAEGEPQELLIHGKPEAIAEARDAVQVLLGEAMAKFGAKPERDRRERSPSLFVDQALLERSSRFVAVEASDVRGISVAKEPAAAGAPQTLDARQQAKRLQELRKQKQEQEEEAERREIELEFERRHQLNKAAAAAEKIAAEARALAATEPKERTGAPGDAIEIPDEDDDGREPFDWVEDTGPRARLGFPAMTPYGAARIERCVTTRRRGLRFHTARLLLASGSTGTVQVPEARALAWLGEVDKHLGTLVKPPDFVATGDMKKLLERHPNHPGAGMVVVSCVEQGRQLHYNLVSADGQTQRTAGAEEVAVWPRLQSCAYLVELATTPPTVEHVTPCLHDYRATRKLYEKGDTVVLEGATPGQEELGVVKKVLPGAKGERLAAIAAKGAAGEGATATLRRALRRCGDEERKRHDACVRPLESMALPLLEARLPGKAKALGVAASLDGSHLRIFVQMQGGSRLGKRGQVPQGAAAIAAVAGGLGALLGCETELLVSAATTSAPTGMSNTPSAVPPAGVGVGPPRVHGLPGTLPSATALRGVSAAAGARPGGIAAAGARPGGKAGQTEKAKAKKGKEAKKRKEAKKGHKKKVGKLKKARKKVASSSSSDSESSQASSSSSSSSSSSDSMSGGA